MSQIILGNLTERSSGEENAGAGVGSTTIEFTTGDSDSAARLADGDGEIVLGDTLAATSSSSVGIAQGP